MLQVQDIYLAPATLHKQKHLLIFNRPASHCQPKAYYLYTMMDMEKQPEKFIQDI
jgi:hypothetical protein